MVKLRLSYDRRWGLDWTRAADGVEDFKKAFSEAGLSEVLCADGAHVNDDQVSSTTRATQNRKTNLSMFARRFESRCGGRRWRAAARGWWLGW